VRARLGLLLLLLLLLRHRELPSPWLTQHTQHNTLTHTRAHLPRAAENCAVAVSSGPAQYVPFIHCLEEFGVQQKAKVSKCAAAVKLSITALNTCWNGPQGKALIAAAARATPSDHTYVPWSTANGVNYCDVRVALACLPV